jgi:radical SAM protein with 4Fe4S-binding SPASM domain
VTLKPGGDAYACALMMDDEDYIGNVRDHSLRELQESHGLRKAADDVARRRHEIAKCRACNWRNFCQGSCTGLTRIKAGSMWATDGFCELRRDLYRKTVFDQALRTSGSRSSRIERPVADALSPTGCME